MSLNIKNPEAFRLAHELAELTGESVTGAVTASVRERLEREQRARQPGMAERLLGIGRDTAARLPEDLRRADHDDSPLRRARAPTVIVDTSALVAILRDEQDAERFARAIEDADVVRLSAASYVELGAVIDQARDAVASRRVDELLRGRGRCHRTADRRAGADRSRGLSRLRPRQWTCRRAEPRRLLLVCPREGDRRSAALQGGGLRRDGHPPSLNALRGQPRSPHGERVVEHHSRFARLGLIQLRQWDRLADGGLHGPSEPMGSTATPSLRR